ncbi:MAG: hypothetical protein ACYC6I_08695 [Bacillota bacterium]
MKTVIFPTPVYRGRIVRPRRLDLGGELSVAVGERVTSSTVIGLNGDEELRHFIRVEAENGKLLAQALKAPGEKVKRGETIAYYTYFFGLGYREYTSPVDGRVEAVSEVTGTVTIKQDPTPVVALLPGTIAERREDDGVTIALTATVIAGAAGTGRPTHGELMVLSPDAAAQPRNIGDEVRRRVVVIPGPAGRELIAVLFRRRAAGLVCGGLGRAAALELERQVARLSPEEFAARFYDAAALRDGEGQAVPTEVGVTIVAVAGYGDATMPSEVLDLLRANDGQVAYLDGRMTEGGEDIRPEVVIPHPGEGAEAAAPPVSAPLAAGAELVGRSAVVIAGPRRGLRGRVTATPAGRSLTLETGLVTEAIEIETPDGARHLVPRANVEVYADGQSVAGVRNFSPHPQ